MLERKEKGRNFARLILDADILYLLIFYLLIIRVTPQLSVDSGNNAVASTTELRGLNNRGVSDTLKLSDKAASLPVLAACRPVAVTRATPMAIAPSAATPSGGSDPHTAYEDPSLQNKVVLRGPLLHKRLPR
jgi:hypothetical protein